MVENKRQNILDFLPKLSITFPSHKLVTHG